MGIKIHKTMGYGFDDLIENDHRIDWDRYEEAIEFSNDELDSYIKLVQDKDDLELSLYWILEKEKKWNMYNHISRNDEFGLDNVIVFGHPSHKNWSRSDDSIDYYESKLNNPDGVARCQRIPYSIHPYDTNKYYYTETGLPVSGDDIRIYNTIQKDLQLSDGTVVAYDDKFLFKFNPDPPSFIKHYAKFMGVHTDYIWSMVPLIYEYWA